MQGQRTLSLEPTGMLFHPDYDPLLPLKEAAKYLAMSAHNLRDLAVRREIEAIRSGNHWNSRGRIKFRLSALNAWADRYTIPMRDRGSNSKAASEGFIFFAQISSSHREIRNYIKMDFCYSAHKAKNALRGESPFPLTLIALMPGGLNDLKLLQARFDHLRIPEGYGWYQAHDEIFEFVQDLPKTPPRPKPEPKPTLVTDSAEKTRKVKTPEPIRPLSPRGIQT